MSAAPKLRYTPEEYLEIDRAAEYKSEYVAGEIFAMAGASEDHNTISFNLIGLLHSQLRGGPCRGFGADMKVSAGQGELYVYPDIVVVCGERQFLDERRDVLTNPTLIIEVLSSTTESFDRGDKFEGYRRLESLQGYVLIAQDRPHVEDYTRLGDGRWVLAEAGGLEAEIALSSIRCTIRLSEIYDGVSFGKEATPMPHETS
jgi:Uma2 family endonuclease